MERKKIVRWLGLALASFAFIWFVFGNWLIALAMMLMIGLHEGGHLMAAKFFGLKTGGFYFLPGLGGISLTNEPARKRWHDFMIYFGGPFVGLLLVLGLFIFLLIFRSKLPIDYKTVGISVIFFWSFINFFNLLPIFPLDGGGMLWAIAKSFWKDYSPNWALLINCVGIIFFFQLTGNWLWVLLLLYFGLNAVLRLDLFEATFEKQDMKKRQAAFGFVCYVSLVIFFAVFALWSSYLLGIIS